MSRVANMIAGRNRGCKRTGATQRATPPRRSTAGEGREVTPAVLPVSVRSSHREQRTLSNETTITPPKGAQDFVGDAHIPLGDPPGTIFVRAWSQPVVQGLVPDCGSSDPRTRMIREAYEFFRWELAKGEQPPGPVRSSAVELIREVADGLLRIVRGRSAAELDAGWMLDQAANAEWNEDVFEQHAEYRRNGPDGPHLLVGDRSASRVRDDAGRVAAMLLRGADEGANRHPQGGRRRKAAERAFVDGLLRLREKGTRLTAESMAQLWAAADLRGDATDAVGVRREREYHLESLTKTIESIIGRIRRDNRRLFPPAKPATTSRRRSPTRLRRSTASRKSR
jgi:hypothetical protein